MTRPVRLLLLSPDLADGQLTAVARQAGLDIVEVESAKDAESVLAEQRADLLLLLPAKGAPVGELLSRLQIASSGAEILVASARSEDLVAAKGAAVATAHLGSREGWQELRRMLEFAARRVELAREHGSPGNGMKKRDGFDTLVGGSQQMQRIYRLIEKTAHHSYPVMILGESGTGKELVARSIHQKGPRAEGPFVPVDCSALTPSLIESELFGHIRGAFTGASSSKQGLMATASGGTLFLDEIGNLPIDLQVKLLRAIQEKEIKPVGSNERIRTDARIIAATNRDLEDGIREGNFRQDLYFRLNVVQLRIPPLRNRKDDIPDLVHHFLEKFTQEGGHVRTVSKEVMERLRAYSWPGNVRELENAIERAVALSSGPILHEADLPSNLRYFSHDVPVKNDEVMPLEDMERLAIYRAIRQSGGDKLAAAKLLGIGKTTLYRKLREYERNGTAKPSNPD